MIWPKLVQETSAASLLHSVPPGDDFTFKILLRVNRVNRALLGLFPAVYHYTFGLRVSVSCSRRVDVSQNKLPCPSSWWWRNTSGGDGAPRWCVFNSFWSDEASWLRGMSYTRVWIHREVLDSKIHSVLVLGVLIGSVSNNTNTEYRQSYSLICIWMKIHQTESFAYLCEFSLPSAPSLHTCSGFYKHFVWHLHIFIRFHCSACFNKRKRQPRRFASVSPCVQKTTQPVWTPICLTVRQRFIWAIWTLVRVTVGS